MREPTDFIENLAWRAVIAGDPRRFGLAAPSRPRALAFFFASTPPAEQVDLSLSGGTAVPAVDYTPGDQIVSFAAGESSKTVQVPVLPAGPSLGTRVVTLSLSPAPGSAPTATAFLAITHNSDTTPPKVIATKMLTKGPNVTGFAITFSKAMAPGPIQNVNNYEIDDPRSIRLIKSIQWATAKREVLLKSAVYDPATHSVTLTTAGKVRKFPSFTILDRQLSDELKLVGQFAARKTQPGPSLMQAQISPITDATGNPLDTLGDGTPGGHLDAMVSQGRAGNKFVNIMNQITSSGTPKP